MILDFRRGTSSNPVGHALIYFQSDDGSVLASYLTVPPIQFDLTEFMPKFLTDAMQGMDLSDVMGATLLPPIPQPVQSIDYLMALAERRGDDVIFAGAGNRSDPMRLAQEATGVGQAYSDLYGSAGWDAGVPEPRAEEVPETSPYSGMSEGEQLQELTKLTGRLRDSVASGSPDFDIERQMRQLAVLMPRKYRVDDLIQAASIPGERGQRLAQLHLERSYKLFHEDYLDLERIDREIESAGSS